MSGCCSADGYGFAPSWTRSDAGTATREQYTDVINDFAFTLSNQSVEALVYAYSGTKLSKIFDIRNISLTICFSIFYKNFEMIIYLLVKKFTENQKETSKLRGS